MRLFCVLGLWMFLSELKTSSTTKIHGHVGKSVSILCSHSWASNNKKYFCRDPCKDEKDTSVRSDQSPKGRYTLKDFGNGTFNVTITDLQLSDSGLYWCGVDRIGYDTYKEVRLTVTKEELALPRRMETQTRPKTTAEIHPTIHKSSFSRSSATTENTATSTGIVNESSPNGENREHVHYILYVNAGLALLVIISAVGLLAVCWCRTKAKKPRRVIARPTDNEQHREEESGVYENRPVGPLYATMKKPRTKSEEKRQSDPLYQNLHFDTSHGDSVYGNLY